MFSVLLKYNNHGWVTYTSDNKLTQICKSIPNLPGVYYFEIITKKTKHIVYIGASGTIDKEGVFSKQLLRKRITNKQNSKQSRQEFFKQKLLKKKITEIKIHWFVTYDELYHDLPGYVEGLLFQEYYNYHKKLPQWNSKFPG